MENDRNKLSEEVSWKSLKSIYSKYGNNLNLNELFDKDLKRFTKYWYVRLLNTNKTVKNK